MTILHCTHTFTACGTCGCIHRVKGRRLPSSLVPFVGTSYKSVPTVHLERYRAWLTNTPDAYLGHVFELWAIDDELDARAGA